MSRFSAKNVDDFSEKILRKHATSQLFVQGDNRYLSAELLRFDEILSSTLELGKLKKDVELSEETKVKIFDFTTASSTAVALEILIKYYYTHKQEDTDWVVPTAVNFNAHSSGLYPIFILRVFKTVCN